MYGIDPQDLVSFVISPTLRQLNAYSESACMLILCTAAQESRLGHNLHQINGPALGIYQVEPDTHADIYENFLLYIKESNLMRCVKNLSRFEDYYQRENELITNLEYATAICRLVYYRHSEPLPELDDINGMAFYWKKYYNTVNGKGTVSKFLDSYERLVKGKIYEF